MLENLGLKITHSGNEFGALKARTLQSLPRALHNVLSKVHCPAIGAEHMPEGLYYNFSFEKNSQLAPREVLAISSCPV